MFRAIASDNFAPFEQLLLELPAVKDKPENLAEVHLFTGVNGSGKTRILSVLSAMLGNVQHLQKRMKGAEQTFLLSADSLFDRNLSNGRWSRMFAASNHVGWQQLVGDFGNWSQQVPAFAYSGYAYVSDANVTAMGTVQRPDRNYCLSFNKPENSSQILLQAITNLLFEAAVDSLNVSADDKIHSRAARLVKSLESTLFEITGTKFQFKIEKFPQVSLFAVWGGTKLSFDVLPDGLRAIIGWLVHALVMMDVWLQGKGDPTNTEAVFLLDEIESHLHPAWQRKILPAFQRLFPKAQIFVATHSPFVIASLNHGWIHSLKMGANGKVKNEKPIAASKGDSYISVVEDIMGVKEWFDPETENLLAEFRAIRDGAYKPEITPEQRGQAAENARKLAMRISERSMELEFMMGKELIQMDRQLANGAGKA
jgi:predicted ATP-binding protein involved in virulence